MRSKPEKDAGESGGQLMVQLTILLLSLWHASNSVCASPEAGVDVPLDDGVSTYVWATRAECGGPPARNSAEGHRFEPRFAAELVGQRRPGQ